MSRTIEQALLQAVKAGACGAVRRLLSEGADPRARDAQSNTALILAGFAGNVSMIKCLLEKGASVDEKTVYGVTPVMAAAINGHLPAVRLLAGRGANLQARAENGQCVLDFAREYRRDEIVAYLATHAGRCEADLDGVSSGD